MTYLAISAGFLLLIVGGDLLVRGAVDIASKLGVSPLLIGLTLVGFGTSTPELLTSVQAALEGSPGIAVGNVVGSNICNILLILGVAAMIQPIRTSRDAVWRDGGVAMLAAVACTGAALLGRIGPAAGLALMAMLTVYLAYTYRRERVELCVVPHAADIAVTAPGPRQLRMIDFSFALPALLTVGGLVLTVIGARLLVDGAIGLSRLYGISETVVGLTVVAIGTSLPELITSIVASLRRHSDVAFGNVVGSNIFNVFGILGVTAIVEPIAVPREIVRADVWVMLAATVLLIVFAHTGRRLSRAEGCFLLLAYAGYLAALALT